VFRRLAEQKESKIEEGHLMPDHVHMLISIQTKYAMSLVVGKKAQLLGQHFWARGYFVNTVGRDEEGIRTYIRNQEKEDQRLDQLQLWR
jgi:putative transposase